MPINLLLFLEFIKESVLLGIYMLCVFVWVDLYFMWINLLRINRIIAHSTIGSSRRVDHLLPALPNALLDLKRSKEFKKHELIFYWFWFIRLFTVWSQVIFISTCHSYSVWCHDCVHSNRFITRKRHLCRNVN